MTTTVPATTLDAAGVAAIPAVTSSTPPPPPAPPNGRQLADESWLNGMHEPGPDAGPVRGQRAAVRPPARPAYKLKTRKPRGGTVWPLILLAGGDFSGKTTAVGIAAESGRFGRTWVLPFGEDADQIFDYDPDAMVVEHDGSLYEFVAAVEQVAEAINDQPLIDGKPQLVMVDSASILWDLISQIAEAKARKTDEAVADLMRNPYAQVNVGPLLWSDAGKTWARIIRMLKNMQAVVVMTARGKDGVVIDERGHVDAGAARAGRKVFRPAVQAETPYATHAYVKLDRDDPPQILGARVGKYGLRPGIDEPIICDGKKRQRGGRDVAYPPFSLEWLVFDLLRFNPGDARTAAITVPQPATDAAPAPAAPALEGADESPGQQLPAETLPATTRTDDNTR